MCRGDTTLATYFWRDALPTSRAYSDHECVNWEALDGWSRSRMLVMDNPNILVSFFLLFFQRNSEPRHNMEILLIVLICVRINPADTIGLVRQKVRRYGEIGLRWWLSIRERIFSFV